MPTTISEFNWSQARFTSNTDGARAFLTTIDKLGLPLGGGRGFDLGCGTGSLLYGLYKAKKIEEGLGLDLSPQSILQAKSNYSEQSLTFMAGDFIEVAGKLGEFDLVVSDSVLPWIGCSDQMLAEHLSGLVSDEGLFCFTMADRSVGNFLKLAVRRLFRIIHCQWLEKLILMIAKIVYTSWSREMLADRLPYLFSVPPRLYGKSFHRALEASGFVLQEKFVYDSTSIVKLRHLFLVYQKKGKAHAR